MTNAIPADGSTLDVIALIEADHRTVRAHLAHLAAVDAGERAALWPELVRLLAVHEVAEEVVVYPAIRAVTSEHVPMLERRIDEQRTAEEQLVAMEAMDPAGGEFAAHLERLAAAVLAHAEAEEREVFPLLADAALAVDRVTLGARYEQAKRRAPIRPHPAAPHHPPANSVVGPLVGLLDRLRDRMG